MIRQQVASAIVHVEAVGDIVAVQGEGGPVHDDRCKSKAIVRTIFGLERHGWIKWDLFSSPRAFWDSWAMAATVLGFQNCQQVNSIPRKSDGYLTWVCQEIRYLLELCISLQNLTLQSKQWRSRHLYHWQLASCAIRNNKKRLILYSDDQTALISENGVG